MGGGGGARLGQDGMDPRAMQRTMQMLDAGIGRLAIAQTDSTVVLTYADDRSLTLFMDGRKVEQHLGDDVQIEIKARWDGERFAVERDMGRVGKITETYLLSPERDQMYVLVKLKLGRFGGRGGGGDIEVRRVYDASGSG